MENLNIDPGDIILFNYGSITSDEWKHAGIVSSTIGKLSHDEFQFGVIECFTNGCDNGTRMFQKVDIPNKNSKKIMIIKWKGDDKYRKRAVKIARKWSGKIDFSFKKVVKCFLSKEKCKTKNLNQNDINYIKDMINIDKKKRHMFCSQFVLIIWQLALSNAKIDDNDEKIDNNDELLKCLPINPKKCMPNDIIKLLEYEKCLPKPNKIPDFLECKKCWSNHIIDNIVEI